MVGSTVGTGKHVTPTRFLEANVKSLIYTIGASHIYNLRLLCPHPDFNAYSRLCI